MVFGAHANGVGSLCNVCVSAQPGILVRSHNKFGQGFPVTEAHACWQWGQIQTHIHFPGQCSGNWVLTGDFMVA